MSYPVRGLASLICSLFLLAPLAAQDAKTKVACVGDSITYGAGVEQREKNNYPKVLGELLGSGYEVRNFGVSGATLLKQGDKPYWKLGEFKQASDFAPQIVIIKLGTNDTKSQNWKHKDQFATDLKNMVKHFQALPSKPQVWLCKPVPVVQDKWGINEKTVHDEVIPAIVAVSEELKVPTIDLYAALSGKNELFPDGVHPNAAGAKLMAQTIHAALTAVQANSSAAPQPATK